MVEYPADLERDVATLDGSVVRLRPIRPDDDARLVAFHGRLSSHSVYLRFFGFHPTLSEAEVRRFTQVDYADRLAFVIELEGRLGAVGRYDRLEGGTEAEVAFVVDDELQHHGLGSLLLDELARAAWARGITDFVAHTLAQNTPMLHVFWRSGFPVRTDFEAGAVRVRFPIEPVPAYQAALAERETSRRLPPGPPPAGSRSTPASGRTPTSGA